jgi:hypothetical protein
VEGLSSDELEFIAEFLGACLLDLAGQHCASRAQWAEVITRYQQALAGCRSRRPADQEHKMILLLEYLCRCGVSDASYGDCLPPLADNPPFNRQAPGAWGSDQFTGA